MGVMTTAKESLLEAQADAPGRPDPGDVFSMRYLRSFLLLRIIIGALALALPVGVWLGSGVLSGEWALRGSLSAYYYSGARELFTGGLWVTGFFLVAYKAFERSLENWGTLLSGVAALGVASFPTGIPSGSDAALTPLQETLGEGVVKGVHYASAVVFIGSLALISHLFAAREGNRTQHLGRRDPAYWKRFHDRCAGVIVAAVVFVGLNLLPGVGFGSWMDDHYLWFGEVVSVLAFGTSWLFKGAELKYLLHAGREP